MGIGDLGLTPPLQVALRVGTDLLYGFLPLHAVILLQNCPKIKMFKSDKLTQDYRTVLVPGTCTVQ